MLSFLKLKVFHSFLIFNIFRPCAEIMASLNLAHIKSMSIRYFPYDSSAKLCRELLRRVRPCSAQVLLTILFPHATRFLIFLISEKIIVEK